MQHENFQVDPLDIYARVARFPLSMRSPYAIRGTGLSKHFGSLRAVDDISFVVDVGEFFGFLGPNGAGKTTTVRMLTGILPPTSGSIEILGRDLESQKLEAKQKMGVVPEMANAYPDLTVWQNMMLMGELYGVGKARRDERASELLDILELDGRERQRAKVLSKGLRQRLLIAMALIHEPTLLFLDEPTSGLDVKSTRVIRELLISLNSDGTTIFLTTHNIEEANQLCDRVCIVNKGRIAATGSPANLRASFQRVQSVTVAFDHVADPSPFRELDRVTELKMEGDKIRLVTDDPTGVAIRVVELAREMGLTIADLEIQRPSLEDVFVQITEEVP